jgi:hypothetical protein
VDELHRRIVKRIRLYARDAGIEVSHLPDRADVGRSHFWDVMAGRKSPTVKWLRKVADALKVDTGDLIARQYLAWRKCSAADRAGPSSDE